MHIEVTEIAFQKIMTIDIPQGFGIRIDAIISGGCGCTVHYELAIDEGRKRDEVLLVKGIPFYLDHFTQVYLEGEITLDYVAPKDEDQSSDASHPSSPTGATSGSIPHGFKLYTAEEILGNGMKIKSYA